MSIIIFSPAKEQFDFRGKSLGMGHDRALFYSKSLGRGRIYRSTYPQPPDNPVNDFSLLDFKNPLEAQATCDQINNAYNDDFHVIEI